MITITGYRSANFVGSPIAGSYRMVSHVVAERGGAILPVDTYQQPRDAAGIRINPYVRPPGQSLSTIWGRIEILLKEGEANGRITP